MNQHLNQNCPFCNISSDLNAQTNLVYEGENIFVITEKNFKSEKDILIISKKHFPSLEVANNEVIVEAFLYAKKYVNAIQENHSHKDFRYISKQDITQNKKEAHFYIKVFVGKQI